MDAYTFAPEFEKNALWHLITAPSLGDALEDLQDVFWTCDETKRLGKLLQAYGKKHHAGPGSFEVMFQLLQHELDTGKLKQEVAERLEAWVLLNLLVGFQPAEAGGVERHVRDTIRAKKQFDTLDRAVKAAGKREDLTKYAEELLAHSATHEKAPPPVIVSGIRGMLEILKKDGDLQRLTTGSYHVDNIIDGGLPLRALGMLLASTGTGKSVFCSNMTAAAAVLGIPAILVVNEDSIREPLNRIYAFLSGLTLNEVYKQPEFACELIEQRWGGIAPIEVVRFEATGCLASSIVKTIEGRETALGVKFGLKVVDYLDVIEGVHKVKAGQNGYETAKEVARYLHDHVEHTNSRLWTPIQSRRLAKAIKKELDQDLDINDGADSQHKVRIADIVLALNRMGGPKGTVIDGSFLPTTEDDMYIQAHCLKHRQGRANLRSETVKADLARAVLFPDERFYHPYLGEELAYGS